MKSINQFNQKELETILGNSDQINLSKMLPDIFENPVAKFLNDGMWDKIIICPEPYFTIEICINPGNSPHLIIDKFVIEKDPYQLVRKNVFSGNLPADENHEPDEDFLKKILENIKSINK
jgi:hypothetical protein